MQLCKLCANEVISWGQFGDTNITGFNKQSSLKRHGARMITFSTNSYFIFQRFECCTTLIVKELLYNKKPNFFTSISKIFVTCITITVTNISDNIIKQYYGIIKLLIVLVIVKKKQFSRTNILIQDRSIMLNKQAFFDFKNIIMMSICQDGKLIRGWDNIAIQEMVMNCTLF